MTRWLDKRWFPWLLRASLVTLALVAYLPSFRGVFIFDDLPWIVDNWKIRSLETLGSNLEWHPRPVIVVSIWLNYALGGLNVVGYHVFNFAVHTTAGLLLFAIVRRTLRLPRLEERWGQRADVVAFVATLLWLIHPLQVQSVTYIIQRCESLMGMFYFLALYCLLRGTQSPAPWRWHLACVAAVWVGMGCKEVMATAPLVLLVYDAAFLSTGWKESLRRRWGIYLAMLPAIALLVYVTHGAMVRDPQRGDLLAAPTSFDYLCSQPAIILHYLRLAFLPDRLCFDYRWPIAQSWADILPGGLAVLTLFIASVYALYRWPSFGFLAFSFFVILSPTSSFNPIADLAVEHRMYLPLALLILMGTVGMAKAGDVFLKTERRRFALYGSLVVVLTLMWGGRTYVRNCVYAHPAALWSNVLAHAPDNARAHHNLGAYLSRCGEEERAMAEYRRAIELEPRDGATYYNLAHLLARKDRLNEAIDLLRSSQAEPPTTAWVDCCLGELLEQRGETTEAITHYRKALVTVPEFGRAHYKLAKLLARTGKVDEAIEHYHVALERKPLDVGCNFRLGYAYQLNGDFANAVVYYERALELKPELDKARRNIALCEAGIHEGEEPSDEPTSVVSQPVRAATAEGESRRPNGNGRERERQEG